MKRNFKLFTVVLLTMTFALLSEESSAQKRKIIQLSGIVVENESENGLPGAHVYVPKAGRGTTTNYLGYFSMPVFIGDSVVFSSVGYKKQHYIVEENNDLGDNVTLIINMVADTTFLEAVEIMPFPTEQMFKEAVLALNIPLDAGQIDNDHMNAELLAYMMQNTPMDGAMNYRNYINSQLYFQNDRYGPRTNTLTNPFNWAKFIDSIKKKKK